MTDYCLAWFRADLRMRPQVFEMTEGLLRKIGDDRRWDRELVRARLEAGEVVDTVLARYVRIEEPGA